MAIMTPVLLILAIFSNLQGIRGALTIMPFEKEFCNYDAFISSQPINNKVFLHPWNTDERQGDWYKARGYCAAHCAEIVRIDSVEENTLFLEFMRSVGMTAPGVWLGAEVDDRVAFTNWTSGAPVNFTNNANYPDAGHTCVSANRGLTTANLWYNDKCTGDAADKAFIACQRRVTWTPCES